MCKRWLLQNEVTIGGPNLILGRFFGVLQLGVDLLAVAAVELAGQRAIQKLAVDFLPRQDEALPNKLKKALDSGVGFRA